LSTNAHRFMLSSSFRFFYFPFATPHVVDRLDSHPWYFNIHCFYNHAPVDLTPVPFQIEPVGPSLLLPPTYFCRRSLSFPSPPLSPTLLRGFFYPAAPRFPPHPCPCFLKRTRGHKRAPSRSYGCFSSFPDPELSIWHRTLVGTVANVPSLFFFPSPRPVRCSFVPSTACPLFAISSFHCVPHFRETPLSIPFLYLTFNVNLRFPTIPLCNRFFAPPDPLKRLPEIDCTFSPLALHSPSASQVFVSGVASRHLMPLTLTVWSRYYTMLIPKRSPPFPPVYPPGKMFCQPPGFITF